MKKILFLVGLLALSLAGCGREESAQESAPAVPEQQSAPAQAPAESGEAAPADDTAPVEGDTAPAEGVQGQ